MEIEHYNSFFIIAKGIPVTLTYSIISVLFGVIIGSAIALLKISKIKIVVLIADIYTSIFRGTPLLIQLFIIAYGIPKFTGVNFSVFWAGLIAFSLNSGAYLSEIIRAGISAIDIGQFEAAEVLGIPFKYKMKDIIIPQAIRNVLPSLVNEVINMLKESAIISVLGEMDIMRSAQLLSNASFDYLTPLLIAALYYYIIVLILSKFGKYLEKKLAL